MAYLKIFIMAVFIPGVWLDRPFINPCIFGRLQKTFRKNVDLSRLSGTWFEYKATLLPFEDRQTRPVKVEHFNTFVSPVLKVLAVGRNISTNTCQKIPFVLELKSLTRDKIPKFELRIDVPDSRKLDVYFASTDYKSYDILYGCLDNFVRKDRQCTNPFVFVLTRRKNPSKQIINIIERILSDVCIDVNSSNLISRQVPNVQSCPSPAPSRKRLGYGRKSRRYKIYRY